MKMNPKKPLCQARDQHIIPKRDDRGCVYVCASVRVWCALPLFLPSPLIHECRERALPTAAARATCQAAWQPRGRLHTLCVGWTHASREPKREREREAACLERDTRDRERDKRPKERVGSRLERARRRPRPAPRAGPRRRVGRIPGRGRRGERVGAVLVRLVPVVEHARLSGECGVGCVCG